MFGKDAEILKRNDDHRRVIRVCARLLPNVLRHRALPSRLLTSLVVAMVFVLTPIASAEITPPLTSPNSPISIRAAQGSRWYEGEYEVWSLEGDCTIVQGDITGRSQSAVVWIRRADESALGTNPAETVSKVIAYLENGAIVDFAHQQQPHRVSGQQANTFRGNSWMGHFHSTLNVTVQVGSTAPASEAKPTFVSRGNQAWDRDIASRVQRAQFIEQPQRLPPTQ
ncbi:MAG: hypothetical protein KDB05_00140, partial [Planctomycetales bacterium]|nr:hypothetical protein [Planctomycetales bacterium]